MSQKCPIWGTPAEVRQAGMRDAFWVRSSRASGDYEITGTAAAIIKAGALDEQTKAKLTTAIINRRSDGSDAPNVDSNLLEESKKAPALSHEARARRLLRYIADRESASPGQSVSLGTEDPGALAHSESWTGGQLQVLTNHLAQEQLLDIGMRTLKSTHYTVTVFGHSQLLAGEARDTKQVFVAMWFGSEMSDAYKRGIKPGIRDAGYTPMRIDEKKDANRIDDDIIGEITKSQLVVADMTHGADGVRGSVYYEAGFAHGQGLVVIYCCRRDCMERLPFDTRQYHHIVWDTPRSSEGSWRRGFVRGLGRGAEIHTDSSGRREGAMSWYLALDRSSGPNRADSWP